MKQIPSSIKGVIIEFKDSVNRTVTDEMHLAMLACISKDIAHGVVLEKLSVSSGSEQIEEHKCPSRHKTGNAVDISRINDKKIGEHYVTDTSVKAIVDALQTKFESAPHRRENFGPTIQKKSGKDHPMLGHDNHFHWSVNGDHSECYGILRRMYEWMHLDRLFRRNSSPTEKNKEICNI